MNTPNCKSCEILARHGQTMLVHTCRINPYALSHTAPSVSASTTVPEREGVEPTQIHEPYCKKLHVGECDCISNPPSEKQEAKICGKLVHSGSGKIDGHACFNKKPCPIHEKQERPMTAGEAEIASSLDKHFEESEKQEAADWERIIEKLADIEHQRWSDWQGYVHSKCQVGQYGAVIPRELFDGWERQIQMPYDELTEREKQSDRDQVMRYWPIILELIAQTRKEVALKTVEEILNKIKEYRCHPDEKHCTCMEALKDYIVSTLKSSLNEI